MPVSSPPPSELRRAIVLALRPQQLRCSAAEARRALLVALIAGPLIMFVGVGIGAAWIRAEIAFAPGPHLTLAHLFLIPAFYGAAILGAGVWRIVLARVPALHGPSVGAKAVRLASGVVFGCLLAAFGFWIFFSFFWR